MRVQSQDADLFPLAGVFKESAKEEVAMTTTKAREQLSQVLAHLHLPEDSFSIRASRLVAKDGSVDFPVRKLVAIIPAHGTVMAVMRRV